MALMPLGAEGEEFHHGRTVIGDGFFQDLDGIHGVVDGQLGRVDVGNGHGLADEPAVQGGLAREFGADGRSGAVAAKPGRPGFLHPGIHVTFIVIDDPGNVEVFAQGVIETPVADVINRPVAGKDK